MEGERIYRFKEVTGFAIFCQIIDLIKDNDHTKNLPYNIKNPGPNKEKLLILRFKPRNYP